MLHTTPRNAPHIAIIGSGPAGYYTAEAAYKHWGENVHIDIFDRMPVPYGLIRSGVAPDHQSVKGVARRYESVALAAQVRFIGHVAVGSDVTVEELLGLYDAVVLATGAPHDRKLDLPGADLPNVFGSAALVGWYNGHPDYATLAPDLSGKHAVVIGNGNVALDVARILAKSPEEFEDSDIVAHALDELSASSLESVTILGRRGPHQISMSPKELGELAHLARAVPHVDPADFPPVEADAKLDPGLRKAMQTLRGWATTPDAGFPVRFAFLTAPRALIADASGKLQAIEVERTRLVDGKAVGTGEIQRLPADLVISCIGYQTSPIAGVPYDETRGRFANEEGRILPGLYCVGWARRGPSGTIGTNRPDGFAIVERIAQDLDGRDSTKTGGAGFDALVELRGLDIVTFRDWQKIDAAEVARARNHAPREKFIDMDGLMNVTRA
ncbi:FAD-dependent oxidoreductase [Novosphingobium rosa]|uniref:FAD-dependent oxidoreductase n=1 Tax=Novosphingobium rosa TaxID=76978 RepID=UPI000836F4DC|nr:FAD-dependent oxidoreductase [Novosphingobium rosa]